MAIRPLVIIEVCGDGVVHSASGVLNELMNRAMFTALCLGINI
jgi:hypothetical protein